MPNYYTPSGKFEPISFLYFVLIAAVAAPILSIVYTYAVWYIPIIYVNVLITAGLGFAIGWLICFLVIGYGKVRSIPLAVFLSFLAALIVIYLQWAVWVDLVLNAGETYGNERMGISVSNISFAEVFSLATMPGALFELIKEINAVGTWGIRGGTISGLPLAIIWAIEAIIIIGIAVKMAYSAAKMPFSERNNIWLEEKILFPLSFVNDRKKLIADLEQGNPNSFDDLTLATTLEENHSLFTVFGTEDGEETYLSVQNNTVVQSDDKLEIEDDEFVEYLTLTPKMTELLYDKTTPKDTSTTVTE